MKNKSQLLWAALAHGLPPAGTAVPEGLSAPDWSGNVNAWLHFRTAWAARLLPLLLLLTLPAVVQAQFNYTTDNGTITITGYTGPGGAVTIPSVINGLSVTSIGVLAFADKNSLTSISIPNSVTSIGFGAFSWCLSLTSVTIPDSVTNIGDAAFSNCTSLTAITVHALNSGYVSVDGVLFNKSQTVLLQYPGGKGGSYTIPNSVSNVKYGAFSGCYGLTNVMIPDSVTSIEDWAFFICTSLANVTIPNSVATIGDSAFGDSTNLTSVTIPNSVTNFGDAAFSGCTSLNNVTIGTNITRIGAYAFADCTSLASVAIPNNITRIGNGAFNNCISLTNVTIPNNVRSIGDKTFENCRSVTSITIPNRVTSIGQEAFADCIGLTSVAIPNSVTEIGVYAFSGCTSLTSATIGDSVTRMESYAFDFCTSLTGVFFQGNAPSVGSDVFRNNNNATVFYLPGTTGWGATFGGRPTALWSLPHPLILNNGPSFGVQTNGFGFIISWATNITVVVEACTNLANPIWSPVGTNALSGGSAYFSDPQWTNYPARFYRVRSP